MMARIVLATVGVCNLIGSLSAGTYMLLAETIELWPSVLVATGFAGAGLAACAWEAIEPVRPYRLPDEVSRHGPPPDFAPFHASRGKSK